MENETFIYKITSVKEDFLNTMTPEDGEVMAEHFGYLQKLLDEGTLFLAGPCLDAAFGIAIFYAESEEAAKKIMESDPAVAKGVMNAELHKFRISLLKQ